jgi:Carboxyltransferase domain, subdomain A and B
VPLVQSSFANANLMKAKFWGKYLLKSRCVFVHTIMMADGPTAGGYPKIGTVASADLTLLAQCVPNKSRIRFRETTVAKAQKKYRALMSGLKNSILEED